MNITVPFNPLKGKTFPVNHHFLVSLSYWTNPFPSSRAVFPLKLNSLWFPLTKPFVVHLFSQVSPCFFSGCRFASASFVTVAGHSSLLQPLLLTKEWHASVAASATQPAPTVWAAVAKVSPPHPYGRWTETALLHLPAPSAPLRNLLLALGPHAAPAGARGFFLSPTITKCVIKETSLR